MAPLPHFGEFRALWLKTTKDKHQHGAKVWEFGTCLWSPTRNEVNARYYEGMKKPRGGDLVLHNYEHTPRGASAS